MAPTAPAIIIIIISSSSSSSSSEQLAQTSMWKDAWLPPASATSLMYFSGSCSCGAQASVGCWGGLYPRTWRQDGQVQRRQCSSASCLRRRQGSSRPQAQQHPR